MEGNIQQEERGDLASIFGEDKIDEAGGGQETVQNMNPMEVVTVEFLALQAELASRTAMDEDLKRKLSALIGEFNMDDGVQEDGDETEKFENPHEVAKALGDLRKLLETQSVSDVQFRDRFTEAVAGLEADDASPEDLGRVLGLVEGVGRQVTGVLNDSGDPHAEVKDMPGRLEGVGALVEGFEGAVGELVEEMEERFQEENWKRRFDEMKAVFEKESMEARAVATRHDTRNNPAAEALQDGLDEALEMYAEQEVEISSLRAQLEEVKRSQVPAREVPTTGGDNNNSLRNETEELKRKIAELEKDSSKQEADREKEKSLLTTEIQTLKGNIEKLEEQIREGELDFLAQHEKTEKERQEQMKQLRNGVEYNEVRCEEEKNALRKRVETLQQEMVDKVRSKERIIQDLQKRIAECSDERRNLQDHIQALGSQSQRLLTVGNQAAERNTAGQTMAIPALHQQIQNLRQQLAGMTTQRDDLRIINAAATYEIRREHERSEEYLEKLEFADKEINVLGEENFFNGERISQLEIKNEDCQEEVNRLTGESEHQRQQAKAASLQAERKIEKLSAEIQRLGEAGRQWQQSEIATTQSENQGQQIQKLTQEVENQQQQREASTQTQHIQIPTHKAENSRLKVEVERLEAELEKVRSGKKKNGKRSAPATGTSKKPRVKRQKMEESLPLLRARRSTRNVAPKYTFGDEEEEERRGEGDG